ncbi:MAG: hypothetical protein RLZZ529_1327 [Bacteroidota bacterium]|jgi:hypothetical protein
MQKIIVYTIFIVLSLVNKVVAQENKETNSNRIKKIEKRKEELNSRKNKVIPFGKKVEEITTGMEYLLAREKNELKILIDSLENAHNSNTISKEQLKELKQIEAEKTAKKIELGLEIYNSKLDSLIQNKVEIGSKEITRKLDTINGKKVYVYSKKYNTTHYDVPSFKIYKSDLDKIERKSKKTTSQFVFAMGLNNAIPENGNIENSDFRVWGSHFYEWGLTYNTRIFKNHNLVHAKYGFSVMYNNLRPTDNQYFVKNGDQTYLATSTFNLEESRLRNVYLTAPFHLEFDFSPKKYSKDGTTSYFRTHESVRLGIGGYAGVRVKSKQLLHYEVDGDKEKNKQKGDFNVSDFNYGLSTYIGYRATSLYLKYDLNPMFKKNSNINQVPLNNVSFGIRWDFN